MEDPFDDFDRAFMEKNFHCEVLSNEKLDTMKANERNLVPINLYDPTQSSTRSVNVKLGDEQTFNGKEIRADDENITDNIDIPNDIISTSTKIIYSLPSFGKMSCLVLLNIHALLYYESMGASLLYLSFFVALARAFEILLKPLIAYSSDETKSKYGRRKPYMMIGCFFYALFLIILFRPPSMRAGASSLAMWFGVFYVLFFIADTVTNVPYMALGPELSSNSKEREKLYIYFYLCQYVGVLFAAAAPVLLNKFSPECDCSFCFNNTMVLDADHCVKQCKIFCTLKTNRHSLLYMSITIGLLFIFSIILLCYKIKEKNTSFNKEKVHFIPSLYRIINNKPFIRLLIPWIIDILISTIFATMLPFFLNFVINPQRYCISNGIDLNSERCSVNDWLGYAISVFFIFCIIFTFVWHYLVSIFGKKKCWEFYSLISIFTGSLFLICDEGSLGTLIFASICCAIPAGGAYLNDVFLSDVIDYDEFFAGKRNEGLYTVFASFIPKIVSIFAQSIPMTIMACKLIL
jgi:Na+/melibiose symporter-like transporter